MDLKFNGGKIMGAREALDSYRKKLKRLRRN